jgi:hypothetical protein
MDARIGVSVEEYLHTSFPDLDREYRDGDLIDRLTTVREKLEEYRAWGVAHVWLVDPHSRRMYTCDAGLNEVERLAAPELGIEITAAQVFE